MYQKRINSKPMCDMAAGLAGFITCMAVWLGVRLRRVGLRVGEEEDRRRLIGWPAGCVFGLANGSRRACGNVARQLDVGEVG